MTRRRLALLLAALVAASGVLPLLLLAVFGLEILRKRGEQASQESLHAIAEQAAARIATYIAQQREMLRAIATAIGGEPDAPQRVRDISLDAPSLGKLRLVTAETPPRDLPPMLKPDRIAAALRGSEVASDTYLAELSPAMDVCVPAGKTGVRDAVSRSLASGVGLGASRSVRLVVSGSPSRSRGPDIGKASTMGR